MTTAKTKTTASETASVDEMKMDQNRIELEAARAILLSLPEKEIVKLTIPPMKLIAWAEELYSTTSRDSEKLEEKGFDVELLDTLQKLAGALRYLQAEVVKTGKVVGDTRKLVEEAVRLRDEIAHAEKFAFRNDPEKKQLVDNAIQGYAQEDIPQHLANLSAIGNEYRNDMEAIKFDLSELERAVVLSARLADLLGAVRAGNGGDTAKSEVMEMRNRAYTCLKQAIEEIRAYGKYVFRNNKEHLRKYWHYYTVRSGNKMKNAMEPETESENAVESEIV